MFALMRALTLGTALAVAMVASTGHAQVPEVTGPIQATLDDVDVTAIVKPLGSPVSIPLSGSIGCEPLEPPLTTTTATLEVTNIPSSLTWAMSPQSVSFINEPGTCPAEAAPYLLNGSVVLNVGAREDAPAFEPLRLQVSMMVTKSNEAGEPREYGPFTNNVTVTPGYHDVFSAQAPTKRVDVLENETAHFEVQVTSLANGESSYTASTLDVSDGLDIQLDPGQLVLQPGETGTIDIAVTLVTGAEPGPMRAFKVELVSASTDPAGGGGSDQQIGFEVLFRSADEGVLGTPGLAPLLALLSMLAPAAAGRRARLRRSWTRRP